MEDYPRTLADFERRFRSEEACRDYLFRVRWPEGFRCPRCGESRAWRLRSALWQCANCAYQASLTAGTIFQDTRTPVKVWFHALWWMTSQKNGVSALGLQRVLGLVAPGSVVHTDGWLATCLSTAKATDVRSRSCAANATLRNCCRASIGSSRC